MANCELQALAYPESCPCEVCFWHLADIEDDTEHVRSQDGHRLMHAQGRQVSVSCPSDIRNPRQLAGMAPLRYQDPLCLAASASSSVASLPASSLVQFWGVVTAVHASM